MVEDSEEEPSMEFKCTAITPSSAAEAYDKMSKSELKAAAAKLAEIPVGKVMKLSGKYSFWDLRMAVNCIADVLLVPVCILCLKKSSIQLRLCSTSGDFVLFSGWTLCNLTHQFNAEGRSVVSKADPSFLVLCGHMLLLPVP